MKEKKSITKEKIKKSALELFNNNDTLSISTNHIAQKAKISTGNLYYHYKNKEEIILDIYKDMSKEFESFNSFELILSDTNPLKILSDMFDKYGNLFLKYKFLIRDISTLLAIFPSLKELFLEKQKIRISQIENILKYLVSLNIIAIDDDEIPLRAKFNWFISSYWQIFSSTISEINQDSITEAKRIVFKLQIYPLLTDNGKDMYKQISI